VQTGQFLFRLVFEAFHRAFVINTTRALQLCRYDASDTYFDDLLTQFEQVKGRLSVDQRLSLHRNLSLLLQQCSRVNGSARIRSSIAQLIDHAYKAAERE
jgi:hypothetical protein